MKYLLHVNVENIAASAFGAVRSNCAGLSAEWGVVDLINEVRNVGGHVFEGFVIIKAWGRQKYVTVFGCSDECAGCGTAKVCQLK